MFKINRSALDNASKEPVAKTALGRTNENLYNTFKLSMINFVDTIKEYAIYDMAHWCIHIDRWIQNVGAVNTQTYSRGDIVFLDLGSQNFKYEPSYSHTCIVLKNAYDSILIVPCSSKKYGRGYRDIIDADSRNGFSINTGVQIECYRWVSKNRVVSSVGKVDGSLLDKIDQWLLSHIPTYKLETNKLLAQVESLKFEKSDLERNNSLLKNQLEEEQKKNTSTTESISNLGTL